MSGLILFQIPGSEAGWLPGLSRDRVFEGKELWGSRGDNEIYNRGKVSELVGKGWSRHTV